MTKIILTKGLPASGKSTWAKELVKSDNSWQRVNRDDVRRMMNGYKFSKRNEAIVTDVCDAAIVSAIEFGCSVIVDETSLNPKVEKRMHDLIGRLERTYLAPIEFEVRSFLDVPIKDCIYRDAIRWDRVGHEVILNMATKWLGLSIEEANELTEFAESL